MLEELSNIRKVLPSFQIISQVFRRWHAANLERGLLFLSPWIFGFLAFTLLPMLATLFFSFLNLRITDGILSTPDFVGLENYQTIIQRSAGLEHRALRPARYGSRSSSD